MFLLLKYFAQIYFLYSTLPVYKGRIWGFGEQLDQLSTKSIIPDRSRLIIFLDEQSCINTYVLIEKEQQKYIHVRERDINFLLRTYV